MTAKSMIIQNVNGTEFAWTLLQLEDGRIQATWREPITGAVNCTKPMQPSEFMDMENFGLYAFNRQDEQIRTIDGREYHLDYHDHFCVVAWHCEKAGIERRAKVPTKRYSVHLIPDADVLKAVNTPILWIE